MTDNKKELEEIKRLLMLFLIKTGATSEEIGYALQLESSVVRKMMPISKIKKFSKNESEKFGVNSSDKTTEGEMETK